MYAGMTPTIRRPRQHTPLEIRTPRSRTRVMLRDMLRRLRSRGVQLEAAVEGELEAYGAACYALGRGDGPGNDNGE